MSLLLAPYTQAMRLGQGFNSYTQQICVDDAVVVNQQRPGNVITNDSTTMRPMAPKDAVPHNRTRQKEMNVGKPATVALQENTRKERTELAMSDTELVDEIVEEELGSNAQPGPEDNDKQPYVEIKKDKSSVAKPNPQGKRSATAAKETKSAESEELEEGSTIYSDSFDDMTDADEAREEANTLIAKKGRTEKTQTTSPKPSTQSGKAKGLTEKDTFVPDNTTKTSRGRTFSHVQDSKVIHKKSTDKPSQVKVDDKEVDREAEILAEQHRYQRGLQRQHKDELDCRAGERAEQCTIRGEKCASDAKGHGDVLNTTENTETRKATNLVDLEKIQVQEYFTEHFNNMSEQIQKYEFDPTVSRGTSQTVTYSSRFVDRLSDVMDDMNVSGPLSIKAGKIGGSGKGSFIDSDIFEESDCNFYISVKVMNQTTNFKDTLIFNPLHSVNGDNFREVYGDSFISGFVEGGEFNALVSMRILDKAKKKDIQAQVEVALTAGVVHPEAQANFEMARSNIETNTEITIQVSWSGGGHIKPMEQQWNIQSLMAAAARFPDLVANCPHRIYAILTKYDSLRSFVAAKPTSFTPLQYGNAKIYTNILFDSFVSYKALYKRLGEQISGVQDKVLEITPWSDDEKEKILGSSTAVTRVGLNNKNTELHPFLELTEKFEASVKGLSDARTAIRRQMVRIVNEVDLIEKNPKLATDENHTEPYESLIEFEERIPIVEVSERLRLRTYPLSEGRIAAKPLSEDEQKKRSKAEERIAEIARLYMATDKLEADEQLAFDNLLGENPVLGAYFQASSAVGDNSRGEPFNNLDFLKSNWELRSIRTEVAEGALVYLEVSYENGIVFKKGASRNKVRVKKFGPLPSGERINSAAIEHGRQKDEKEETMPMQVLGLRLFTNRGRSMNARALYSESGEKGTVVRDGVAYENVSVLYMDIPFNSGSIKGFFGRSDDGLGGKIYRLGIILCRLPETTSHEAEVQYDDTSDTVDSEDFALLQKDQMARTKSLQEIQQKLHAAQQALEESRNEITKRDHRISELEKSKKQSLEMQCGSFNAREKGWIEGENSYARCMIPFSRNYPTVPRLLFGMSVADAGSNKPRCLSLALPEVTTSGFSVQAGACSGCYGYNIGCSWLTLPDDLHLETGMTHACGDPNGYDNYSQQIFFSQSFRSPPKICVWIQGFEWHSTDFMSMKCYATDTTPHSFNIRIDSWADRRFQTARVQYLAYPSEEDGKRVKSGRKTVVGAQKEDRGRERFYGQPFETQPKTFIAISELDFSYHRNLRFYCSASAPNNEELEWSFGTWWDSDMDHGEVQWIAIE